MRLDLLLNPGTPPPSPLLVPVPAAPITDNKSIENVPAVEPISKSKIVLPSEVFLSNQRTSSMLDDEEDAAVKAAVKRVKRELPGVRLLLECVDNQRDDTPGIFSGQAFWGNVPSLNVSVSPTDTTQLVPSVAVVLPSVTPTVSFLRELAAAAVSPVESSTTSIPEESTTSSETNQSEEDDMSVSEAGSKRKKITICKEAGCKSQVLSKQLCMKHGGGPRCSYPDCNNGAKLKNLCFQHGGSTICLAPGCSSKAKRFGYCWSHGGGRICAEEDCNKVAAQGGMCWAHGGGNRCKLDGCTKRSYKQYDYYCKRHANEVVADY